MVHKEKGCLIYSPGSCHILASDDIVFAKLLGHCHTPWQPGSSATIYHIQGSVFIRREREARGSVFKYSETVKW